MIASIINFFRSGKRISKFENLILAVVRSRLSKNTALQWDRQISAVNKVQRLPGGVEVNFYRMKFGAPTFDSSIAFSNKSDELLVANLRVSSSADTPSLAAKIWSVSGFVFSIEYEGDPAYFEEAMESDLAPLSIDCEIINDPGGLEN